MEAGFALILQTAVRCIPTGSNLFHRTELVAKVYFATLLIRATFCLCKQIPGVSAYAPPSPSKLDEHRS